MSNVIYRRRMDTLPAGTPLPADEGWVEAHGTGGSTNNWGIASSHLRRTGTGDSRLLRPQSDMRASTQQVIVARRIAGSALQAITFNFRALVSAFGGAAAGSAYSGQLRLSGGNTVVLDIGDFGSITAPSTTDATIYAYCSSTSASERYIVFRLTDAPGASGARILTMQIYRMSDLPGGASNAWRPENGFGSATPMLQASASRVSVFGNALGQAHGNYRCGIVTTNSAWEIRDYELTDLTEYATTPVITTNPASATRVHWESVTFNSNATSYAGVQWFKDGVALVNGGRISGAQSLSLTITDIQASDAGTYVARYGNSLGTTDTTAATLTVNTLLTATTLATKAPTANTIVLTWNQVVGVPDRGTVTYQAYRSLYADFTPSPANALPAGMLANRTLTDNSADLAPGTIYFYKLVARAPGQADAVYPVVMAALVNYDWTLPIASYAGTARKFLVFSSSTFTHPAQLGGGGFGNIVSRAQELLNAAGVPVTWFNAAVGGTVVGDFLPGGSQYNNALNLATSNAVDAVFIGPGSNNATGSATFEGFRAQYDQLVQHWRDLGATHGWTVVLYNANVRVDDGGSGQRARVINEMNNYQLCWRDELGAGGLPRVLVRGRQIGPLTANNLQTIDTDNIHQTFTGSERLAQILAQESRAVAVALDNPPASDVTAPAVRAWPISAAGTQFFLYPDEFTVDGVAGFSATVAGVARGLTVSRLGRYLRGTLATPAASTEAVALSYDAGAGDLLDPSGNEVAGFSGLAVPNDSTAMGSVAVESVAVSAAGGATSVQPGATLQMSAAVSPAGASQSVTWGVEGDTSGGASISAGGLLTAGLDAGSVTVRATSTAAPGVSGTYAVTVLAAGGGGGGLTAATLTAALRSGQLVPDGRGGYRAADASDADGALVRSVRGRYLSATGRYVEEVPAETADGEDIAAAGLSAALAAAQLVPDPAARGGYRPADPSSADGALLRARRGRYDAATGRYTEEAV